MVDHVQGLVKANVWLRLKWQDARLVWNPGEWQNISEMSFNTAPGSAGAIWTPDIILYNTAEKPHTALDHTRATVDNTGMVHWSRPGMIMSSSQFDLKDFPFDKQATPLDSQSLYSLSCITQCCMLEPRYHKMILAIFRTSNGNLDPGPMERTNWRYNRMEGSICHQRCKIHSS